MFLCLWLHWILVAIVRILIPLTRDGNWAPCIGSGVLAREIPGARVFREVIKFKRGHGVNPLQAKRDIREFPVPSESACRKDLVKTQWEDSSVQGRCLPWSQPSNLRNCEKTRLLFKPPSLVLCYSSWSRLVNKPAIERSTHTNLEKVNTGSFSFEKPKISWRFSFSGENWNIVSVSPHIWELSHLHCGSSSGPQQPSSSGGCDQYGLGGREGRAPIVWTNPVQSLQFWSGIFHHIFCKLFI